MRCPVCNFSDTKVVDSRMTGDGLRIRRRRECMKCGYRFSTFEEVEILDVSVVKRDGRREPYLREKLENGLRKALEKRPFTGERFKSLVGSIERDIQKKKKAELTSREIGEIVMKRLRQFDTIAYIRFASVYRSFTDVKTFQDEIDKLMAGRIKKA
ncbi:transcriptional repressor NrdR [Candidatus Uhrbacteria bacterium]|nr:transcriptional repressor NrdR [Candidatus Uhrbacteria bacterium]